MQNGIALLVLLGVAQASNVLKTQEMRDMSLEDDGLTIKMPEAIVPEKMPIKEAPKVGLSLVQSESQLGMFESRILHASLKPVLKAKVKNAMKYVRQANDAYEHGTVDQKKAIQDKAHGMIMNGAGARFFNEELCLELWGETSEFASKLSWFYCPEPRFPTIFIDDFFELFEVEKMAASRQRSAYLSYYLWTRKLTQSSMSVSDLLADNIIYFWGYDQQLVGKANVDQVLPYVGFPSGSWLSSAVEWHCDLSSCITPVAAWSAQKNYVYASFNDAGKADYVIIPLSLWR